MGVGTESPKFWQCCIPTPWDGGMADPIEIPPPHVTLTNLVILDQMVPV